MSSSHVGERPGCELVVALPHRSLHPSFAVAPCDRHVGLPIGTSRALRRLLAEDELERHGSGAAARCGRTRNRPARATRWRASRRDRIRRCGSSAAPRSPRRADPATGGTRPSANQPPGRSAPEQRRQRTPRGSARSRRTSATRCSRTCRRRRRPRHVLIAHRDPLARVCASVTLAPARSSDGAHVSTPTMAASGHTPAAATASRPTPVPTSRNELDLGEVRMRPPRSASAPSSSRGPSRRGSPDR